MKATLVDSNVILDLLTEDPEWFSWSSEALEDRAEESVLVIDPIIYAEVSIRFERVEDLELALPISVAISLATLQSSRSAPSESPEP